MLCYVILHDIHSCTTKTWYRVTHTCVHHGEAAAADWGHRAAAIALCDGTLHSDGVRKILLQANTDFTAQALVHSFALQAWSTALLWCLSTSLILWAPFPFVAPTTTPLIRRGTCSAMSRCVTVSPLTLEGGGLGWLQGALRLTQCKDPENRYRCVTVCSNCLQGLVTAVQHMHPNVNTLIGRNSDSVTKTVPVLPTWASCSNGMMLMLSLVWWHRVITAQT